MPFARARANAVGSRSSVQSPRESASERIREGYRMTGILEDDVLDEDLFRCALNRPDAPYATDERGTYTYGQVWRDVLGLAGTLQELGVGRGDIVSFQLPNRVEAAVVYVATVVIGAICNPIVPIYREREVGFILRQARPKVVVIPGTYRGVDYGEMYARASKAACHYPTVVAVDGNGTGIDFRNASANQPGRRLEDRSGTDEAVLLYTSGTTSDPKGVLHSHQTLRYECRSIIELSGLLGSDIVFMASPVTHVTGLLYGLQMPAMLGASCILQETWNAGEAYRLIRELGCTFTVGATPFLHGLIATQSETDVGLDALRCFICGGADVPPELVIRARSQLNVEVMRAYGLTELPTVTCCSLNDRPEKRAGTDGRPLPGTRVRVRDDQGIVRESGNGELEASAPEMFLGYLDATLNESAFSDDGWFRTGDLASIDSDGYVTILGRIKDVIVRGGENISAKEVEDILFEHPNVSEIAVVGYPDPVMGQRMCAFVVPVVGSRPSRRDLMEFLDERGVARQKAPERVEILYALPKTPSGKVQKTKLRDLAISPVMDPK
jgi:cyclohexanecarboxylate-CoA ligase